MTKFGFLGAILDRTDKIFTGLDGLYRRLLNWSIHHRKTIIFIAIAMFVSSMISIPFIGSEFFPTTDEGAFSINIELENGARVEEVSATIDKVVEKIIDIPELDYLFSNTSGGGVLGGGQNTGRIQGVLKAMDQRDKSVFAVINDIEALVGDIPGAKITVSAQSSMGGMGGGSAISIEVKGDDLNRLSQISDSIISAVKDVTGTKNVSSSLSDAVPQVEISLKPNASQYGLTTMQVANEIKAVIEGHTATRYKFDGEEIDVVLEGEDLYNESIANLKQIPIQSPTGIVVPVELVADVSIGVGPVMLTRMDQARTVTVTADLNGRDLGAVTSDIQVKLDALNFPKGYTAKLGGQDEMMTDAFKDLIMALILAIVLVYIILASQFESFLMPFIIMFSTPLAISGGLLGLFFTGRTLNITSMIGFILLAGVVVNNAIVLVDYINTRRKTGEGRDEAVIAAGPIRLRPILMTTLTTVLGLVPMSLGIGEGAELQASMATVVIVGLSLSTLLTLVFIPVMYIVFDNVVLKQKNKRNQKKLMKQNIQVIKA